MTAEEYLTQRRLLRDIIRKCEFSIESLCKSVEIPPVDQLERATSLDIYRGNILYYRVDEQEPYWKEVCEVQYADDQFKAYVAEDGCRYGLDQAWVRK